MKSTVLKLIIFNLGLLSFTNLSAEECFTEPSCNNSNIQNVGFYAGIAGGINKARTVSKYIRFSEHYSSRKGDDVKSLTIRSHSKPCFFSSGSVGYRFSPTKLSLIAFSPRIEGEFSYRKTLYSKSRILTCTFNKTAKSRSMSYFVNFLVDLDLGLPVTPFFGYGIGYTHYSKMYRNTRSNNQLTQQLIAGLSYSIYEKTELALDYRYIQSSGLEKDSDAGSLSVKRFF